VKVYTRTGDDGTTAVFGGGRVPKDDPRVAAYGAVDEANSALGMARAAIASAPEGSPLRALDDDLQAVQSLLFDLGADLATPLDSRARTHVTPVDAADAERLERLIDAYTEELPPLRTFVLPAGTQAAASLHLARSVVRRAERGTLTLSRREPVNPQVLVVLNRLSDLLFTLARVANVRAGVEEVKWTPRR
jgi:cob(I)alamin adenosyltransferase